MSLDNFFDRMDVLFKPAQIKHGTGVKMIQISKIGLPISATNAVLKYYGDTVEITKVNQNAIIVKRAKKDDGNVS